MKGLRIVLIVILSGIMVLLGEGLVRGIRGEAFPAYYGGSGECTLQAQTEADGSHIEEIIVDMKKTPFDVIFLRAEDERILIREYYNKELKESELASVSLSGGQLNIRARYRSGFLGTNSVRGYVEIYLPEAAGKEIKLLQAQTDSGDIAAGSFLCVQIRLSSTSGYVEADDISCEEASLSATSGDILVESLESSQSSLSTTSGDVQVQRLEGVRAGVSTTSGDIFIGEAMGELTVSSCSGDQEVERIQGNLSMASTSGELMAGSVNGSLSMSSTSGDIRVKALTGTGEFHTVSGEILAYVEAWKGDIRAESTSGDVSLILPAGSGGRVELHTVSGDISTGFDDQLSYNAKRNQANGTVGTEPLYDISISTTSGEICIE